jgi:predicted nuclease of predicted toxin-antitoxin system
VLLLDEMLPAVIAHQVTAAGCDTDAVSARPDLRGAADVDVLVTAAREGRVLVTDNIRDFVPLSNAWAAQGRSHPGIVLISSKAFPMSRGRSGRIASALCDRCRDDDWPAAGQFDFLRT